LPRALRTGRTTAPRAAAAEENDAPRRQRPVGQFKERLFTASTAARLAAHEGNTEQVGAALKKRT